MKKLYAKIKRYWYKRKWKKLKAEGLGMNAYDFPSVYLSYIEMGFSDTDLADRTAAIHTSLSDIGEALNYLYSVHEDIVNKTLSNRIHSPLKKVKGRVMRADAFMYNSNEGMYVSMTEIMTILRDLYSDIKFADTEKSHSYHYRTRSFIRPLVEHLHVIFIDALK